MKLQQLDRDIPKIVNRFFSLLNLDNEPLEERHFLVPLILTYRKWSVEPNFKDIPQEVLQIGSISNNVFLF